MEQNQISRTAMGTAFMRGYHAVHVRPPVFDDRLAYDLFPEEIRSAIAQKMTESAGMYSPEFAASCPDEATALAWVMSITSSSVVSRARYTEDCLERAMADGVEQYVILGAGFDTFAFRRPELVKRLQVFEVDHPGTQGFKQHRIGELGWKQPEQLHFVAVDFATESLTHALGRTAYDPAKRTFFSWLGVVYYLTRDAVYQTLHTIAEVAPKGSGVVFDFMEEKALIPSEETRGVQILMERVKQLGEPMITGFDPKELGAKLPELGMRLYEHLGPLDIEERYFKDREDDYHATKHTHFVHAVVG